MSTPTSRPSRACLPRLVLLSVMVAVLVGLAPPAAHAHTDLVSSTPADGAEVGHLPAMGTLVFSEPVSVQDVAVAAGGEPLPIRQVQPSVLRVDLRAVKETRTVVLAWRLVSAHDGHEASGKITLHLRAAAAAAPAQAALQASPPATEPRTLGWLSVSSRVLGYLALAVFVGGLLFVSTLWPVGAEERRTRIVLAAAVVGGVRAAIEALVVVHWRTGGDVPLEQTLATDVGRSYTVLVLLWLLATVVVAAALQRGQIVVQSLPWRVGAVAVALGLIRTSGMTSHASQTTDPGWGILADFVHVSAVSAWVGGLVVLSVCLLPRARIAELERVVPRFSTVALTSVLLIVLSGILLLWQIAGSVDGFWTTHYSRVLVVKLALFTLVLLVALQTKRWVDLQLLPGRDSRRRSQDSPTVRAFAVSVGAEALLVLAVLSAVGVLVTSSPGV